ncbi:MAG: flavodoxin family protein [Candidatus Zixiibacteriota bacterium]|nr:MAG: flavodoxin family protein [candidate division Zixibacteria bacterium]
MASDSSEKLRVLGVVGSPRKGGNTDILVDAVLAGAERAGAESSKIYLGKLNLKPCRACEGCKKAGRCVNDDDMQLVLSQMDQSTIWVLGTPVYFWGPTGWFKAFVDRWYGAREHINFAEKKAILAVPFEDTKTATARHTVGMIKDALDYMKTPLLASIVVPGVLNKGDVNSHEETLAAASRAGYDAVVNHNAALGAE